MISSWLLSFIIMFGICSLSFDRQTRIKKHLILLHPFVCRMPAIFQLISQHSLVSGVLFWFQVEKQKASHQQCFFEIILDDLTCDDIPILVDTLSTPSSSDFDFVDIYQKSSNLSLDGDHLISIFSTVCQNLRIVDLSYFLSSEDVSRFLCRTGIGCKILNLHFSSIQKLGMTGKFLNLHTLNLDFNVHLSSFHIGCFSRMPKLMRLSMCDTRVANIWTSTAALSKLQSLVELRFQYCSCCYESGHCPVRRDSIITQANKTEGTSGFPYSDDIFSSTQQADNLESLKKQTFTHSSPICSERYYREYIISSLSNLNVLDDLPIQKLERVQAGVTYKMHFQSIPYDRQYKENAVAILQRREIGNDACVQKSSKLRKIYRRESRHSISRSLCAAKVSSSPRPHLQTVSRVRSSSSSRAITFSPRQFEYHPEDERLMVFGTFDGELVVINHESEKLVGYVPSTGVHHNILGLCWLKKYPSKFIAGSNNGSVRLYDVNHMSSRITNLYCDENSSVRTFDDFMDLTSVHRNSSDEYFIASGDSGDVVLYNIDSGKRLQILRDLHQDYINVVKFAHHSPYIFATASFDRTVKMWDLRQGVSRPCYTISSSKKYVMACFSPDDLYLLTSGFDNEVKQLIAVDGRASLSFSIPPTGITNNCTRSYYLNGRDYIIAGSSEEKVVHICCSQSGRRLKDVCVEDFGSRDSMIIQSLRGDPFRAFNLSVILANWESGYQSDLVKINLLQSDGYIEEEGDDESVYELTNYIQDGGMIIC